jgi:hypothetical protein
MNTEKAGANPRNDLVASLMGSQSGPTRRATRCDASCGDHAHRIGAIPKTQNVLRL